MYSICFYLIFISCSQSCYFLICSDCFVFYFIQFRLFVLHSVKKIYCCNLLSDHSLTTLFANERSFQLRKKCFGEKTVSYCFYQCLIPDIMTEICLYCLLNILKIPRCDQEVQKIRYTIISKYEFSLLELQKKD